MPLPPQGLTPHLSAMSPLDEVSLQIAAALASDFASPGPDPAPLLPAPGTSSLRDRGGREGAPSEAGSGHFSGQQLGWRHVLPGLPPVPQHGPPVAMGTTSSAGVIAAARRAVAAVAAAAHDDAASVNSQRQQDQRHHSAGLPHRAEVRCLWSGAESGLTCNSCLRLGRL